MGGGMAGAMHTRWEIAFVAVSALLDEPLEAIVEALDDTGRAIASETLRALASNTREERARALARALSEVAVAVDALRLA